MIFEYDLPPSNLEWSRLAIMRADGSKRQEIPLPPAPVSGEVPAFVRGDPTFTSDGRHVLYTRTDSASYAEEIWSAALDGTRDRRLAAGALARMSPDGRRIAYARPIRTDEEDSPAEVWIMSARTGRRIHRLWRGFVTSIDWSPDGEQILFTGRRPDLRSLADAYVVRADGTGSKRLTSTPKTSEREAVWSPNGRRLAVVREERRWTDECCQSITESIWTMRPDGTNQRRILGPLERHDEASQGPVMISWQPLRR